MSIMTLYCPLLALAAITVASCSGGDREVRTSPLAIEQPLQTSSISALSSAAYVASAASIDLYQIQSSELAQHGSRSAAVREFASRMMAAHRGSSAQLSLAGRRLNLLPSAKLNDRHQRMLQSLTSTADFDSTYRRQQAIIHQEALSLHGGYAAKGTSPTLLPVARGMKAIVERNLRMLRYLKR